MSFGPKAPQQDNSTSGSLASGAMGQLGTNVLQQDISTLSTRIEDLTTAVNNLVSNMQAGGSSGGLGGTATKQQGPANSTASFPKMNNSSRQGAQTSGGNGGYGNNTSGMSSGGYSSNRNLYSGNGGFTSGVIASVGALAGYGAAQSQNLVSLNSFATQSLIGYNYNGMSQNQATQQLYGQVGATPGSQISIGTGTLQDNIAMAQTLQGRAGATNISSTPTGKNALSATYGFGITNPTMSAASDAQNGAGLYSQAFSRNMMTLGYGQTILSRSPGGVNLNSGQSAMAIMKGLGIQNYTSAQMNSFFQTGSKGQAQLNYLTNGTGVTSSALQSYLTDYGQLVNNKHMSVSQATNLMNQAASGNPTTMQAARAQLSKDGITTANNDLASLVQNQASQTGRAGDVASGFNSGLQTATGLLEGFNNVLNSILKSPLGTALGAGGGFAGTMAGSALGSGTNMLGTAGSYMMMRNLLNRTSTGAAGTAAAGDVAAG